MAEYVDFRFMPLEGKITGKQVLKQTEDAINDLGRHVYEIDINNELIQEAIDTSNQAIDTAEAALSAVTTNRAMWFNSVTEMKSTDIALGITAATRGKVVFNDGDGAFYAVRAIKGGDVDSDDTVFLDNGNVAERIKQFNFIAKGNNIVYVADVADLRTSDAVAGLVYGTTGYYVCGDGGAGLYSIRTATQTDIDNGGSIIVLDNGNVAELITDGTVNVKQFGAKGDGVTDDTTCFQNALNFADTVVVPKGTYFLDSIITFTKDGQKIVGNGDAEILCYSDTQVIYATGLSNLEVSNLYFNGTGNTKRQSTVPAFLFEGCTNVSVTHNKFENILFGSCIYFRACDGVNALYNDIEHYYFAGILCTGGTKNVVVNHNRVIDGQGQSSGNRYPICLSAVDGATVSQPDAYNLEAGYNYVEDVTPQWEGIDIHGGNKVWIHDNTIKNTMVGIAIVENSRTAEHIFQNVVIESNYIEPATVFSETLDSGNGAFNIVGEARESGLSNTVVIANNIVKNANKKGGTYWGGIRLGNVYNCTISNNLINAFSAGIKITSRLIDVRISDNIISMNAGDGNGSAGIRNQSTVMDNVVICNNTIESATEYNLAYGFYDNVTNANKADTPVLEYGNTFRKVNLPRYQCYWWRVEETTYTMDNRRVGIRGDIVKNAGTNLGNNSAWLCTVSADPANSVKPTWIGINQRSFTKSLSANPIYIGEVTIQNGNIYMAAGTTSADWKLISPNYQSAAPSSGSHAVGEIVYNDAPTAGGYVGWVCVTAGTPGTWKGFGAIES